MFAARLSAAKQCLDDARSLLVAGRLESAVSRAHDAAYQAMWAALGELPSGERWRHLGIISHFGGGQWCEPVHLATGPGLLEPLRLPLHRLYQFRIGVDDDGIAIDRLYSEECVETAERTIVEILQRTQGGHS
jgi:hypothetical protein